MLLDIIIPILNEETVLKEKHSYFQNLSHYAHLIFVDGGSNDKTVSIAEKYGSIISSPSGRGIQKNTGVQHAKTDHLLFLHVDTFIDPKSIKNIQELLKNKSSIGCLTMHIDQDSWLFKTFSNIVNYRAKHFGVIDGDLGFFIHKDTFYQLNKFPELPYMEDIVFSKTIKNSTKITVLKDIIHVSSRKWHEQGFWITFFRYMMAYVQLGMGKLQ